MKCQIWEGWSPQTHLTKECGSWRPSLPEASDLPRLGHPFGLSPTATCFAHLHHLPSPCDVWFNYTAFALGFDLCDYLWKETYEAMLGICISQGKYLICSWEQKGRDCWNGKVGGRRRFLMSSRHGVLHTSAWSWFLVRTSILSWRTDETSCRRAPTLLLIQPCPQLLALLFGARLLSRLLLLLRLLSRFSPVPLCVTP